ncbi:hypothetical protein [Streptomyces sp. NPDC017638]
MPFSHLDRGFLTGTGENFQRDLDLADQVSAPADEVGATPTRSR